ncbi:uncharacterized protein F4812DRAFT_445297 [Daldinia caldariorum]|uniref:uncharacterized protein n=1 Tax=Daldinia caldariorum TaxID=326644 RepID=UPI002007229A|nr:uncharacterized protein F4812DRAFT_445297 [Daldinia caldariorum]KAI1463770.1 hypothetical protein F4812DRAFT_445297 [Daldinia caldariorum]
MYRSALRSAPRVANSLRSTIISPGARRFASTSPEGKKRSWKSTAVRWGLAAGIVYFYSTGAVFAEEPLPKTSPPPPEFSDQDLPTVEAVVAQKRREAEARLQKAAAASEPPTASLPSETSPSAPAKHVEAQDQASPPAGSPEALEEEADQQGAFNPETGEINWDCPCLGGMAHGPCGEEFKAAFSCFVYSKEEPKGMDCIDKFQHMQDCFRLHPEVYGEELDDEDAPREDAPEIATDKSAVKTSSSGENDAETKLDETTPAKKGKSAATADVENGAAVKEAEKQNVPPAQP